MNILFICRRFWPSVGGVEKHARQVAVKLTKRGNKVTVLTEKYDRNLRNKEIKNGIKIVRFPYPKIKLLGLLYIWFRLFKNRSLIEQSEIIHCHDVFVWYLPFRFLYPKKAVYTTFHGWEGIYPIPLKNIFLKRLSAALSRGNICVGEFIERHYGIKADAVTYGAVSRSLHRSVGKDRRSIVYVGRLEADTGLPVFLDVLRKLENYTIEFCGDGSLRESCENFGKVRGFVDPKDYLAKAEICFGSGYLSILEAFDSKCLVVALYHNQLKKDYYTLTPFAKWLICDSNPAKICEKINFYLNKPNLAMKIRKEAQGWAREQTWDKLADLY